MIQVKRAYEAGTEEDGVRFLVERLWPRGIKKEDLVVDGWLKDLAPSTELRKWFNHDPTKWDEFRQRYFRELEKHATTWGPLLARVRRDRVTLVFSAHDTRYNNAIALKQFLESKTKHG
ncbi:MAG: DUF488 domain-containing protein [Alphaproteobacteria bacterium]